MAQPWYTYSGFYNYGGPEPMGNYPKPDLNICAPSGTSITVLMPGTVTAVQPQHFGGEIGTQYSVTVQNANPPNSMAQYSAYNYLGSASAKVGQVVNFGDQIGTALGQGVCTAFAWTNQSPYGSGDFTGNKSLDPTSFLTALKSDASAALTRFGQQSNYQGGSSSNCAPWDIPCLIGGLYNSDQVRKAGLMFVAIVVVVIGLVLVFR